MDKMKAFLAQPGDPAYDEGLSEKGVMLVHGPAGSGKTLFCRELEYYILKNYYEEQKKKNKTVVLVKSQLPILQKPLTDLFWETMRRQYNLRDVQIHSLMDKILDENDEEDVEVIFLLDSYDEMRAEFRNKNLFTTNNLGSKHCLHPAIWHEDPVFRSMPMLAYRTSASVRARSRLQAQTVVFILQKIFGLGAARLISSTIPR